MSKNNGNGKGFEKYHFDELPEGLQIRDGLGIVAAGEGDTPSEVQLYCKVPGAEFASRFTFHNAALLTDFIEQLIAYRNYVFPDAPEINTNVKMDDTQ
ncbi:MAG: hypothetical protein MJE68_14485 [Proteobacteria bacterium]|nr:hypothetical protein [Pseudomonadota bacterium]